MAHTKSLIAFPLVIGACLLQGCISSPPTGHSRQAIFQSIDIGNEGTGIVDHVSINYGGVELIGGPARARYLPKPGVFGSTTLTSQIPERIEIYWVSDDSLSHKVSVPSGDLVKDVSAFYGFKLSLHDHYVDVYLTEKISTPGPYLNLKDTKVFSSSQKAANTP